MTEPHDVSSSAEALAFQVLLQKLIALEQAVSALPPLLKKIIDHLEAQSQQPEVPVATYAQLYPDLQDAAYEEEGDDAPTTTEAPLLPAPIRPRRFWHWFMREV